MRVTKVMSSDDELVIRVVCECFGRPFSGSRVNERSKADTHQLNLRI